MKQIRNWLVGLSAAVTVGLIVVTTYLLIEWNSCKDELSRCRMELESEKHKVEELTKSNTFMMEQWNSMLVQARIDAKAAKDLLEMVPQKGGLPPKKPAHEEGKQQ